MREKIRYVAVGSRLLAYNNTSVEAGDMTTTLSC